MPWQVRAIISVCPIERVTVWAPTPASRERLAAQLAGELAVEVRTASSAAAATCRATIVCCATTAPVAFLEAEMLSHGGVVVVAIGAYRPDMAEIALSVFQRAGRVYVDDVAAVRHEGGDVIAALDAGVVDATQVVPVGGVTGATSSAWGQEGVTVFKSVGSAVEDAAVATALLEA